MSPHQPRYTAEEIARRGDEIYEREVRARVEAADAHTLVGTTLRYGHDLRINWWMAVSWPSPSLLRGRREARTRRYTTMSAETNIASLGDCYQVAALERALADFLRQQGYDVPGSHPRPVAPDGRLFTQVRTIVESTFPPVESA